MLFSNSKTTFIFFVVLFFNANCLLAQTKDEFIVLGKTELQNKHYAQALQLFTNYNAQFPNEKDGLYWLAYTQVLSGNYDQAEKLLKQGLKKNNGYYALYDAYALFYSQQQDYENAVLYYNESLKLNPGNAASYNARGLCYNYLGKYDLAYKDFNDAVLNDSTLASAYNNRATARYNNQNIAKANTEDLYFSLKDLNVCLKLEPNNALAFRNRGIVFFYLDSLGYAKNDLEHAVGLNNSDVNAHYFLGKTYYGLNEKQLALAEYNKTIILENYKAEFYIDRGIALTDLKQFSAARTDFYQAQQISNDFVGIAFYQTARSYAAEGNKKAMCSALKAANKVKLFKKYPGIFNEIKQDKNFDKYEKDKDFYNLIQKFKFD